MVILASSLKPFRQIFEALQQKSPQTLTELTQKLGMSKRVVKKYIQIIEYLQHTPSLDISQDTEEPLLSLRKADFTWQLWEKPFDL